MDSKSNIRITSLKKSGIDSFADFYIGLMIEREIEEEKKIFNSIKIGFKSQQFMDAGYIYAPYIPLNLEQVAFTPSQGIASRYAKKIMNSSLYGVIRISEL